MALKKKPAGRDARRLDAIAGSEIAARTSVGTGGIPYREWSDLDLVASLVDESGDAYAELYRRHSASVTSAARMVLLRDERCEDVVAEVFVGLWFFPEMFDPNRGSLLAFLRLKARGRSIDLVRMETSRRRREVTDERAIVGDEENLGKLMEASEEALAIRNALAQLPATEREPISLAFFSGMSYRAVAAQLNLPEGTVKSRIRAGLSHLQANRGLQLMHDSAFNEIATDVPVRGDPA